MMYNLHYHTHKYDATKQNTNTVQSTKNLEIMKWAFVTRKAVEKHLVNFFGHGNWLL